MAQEDPSLVIHLSELLGKEVVTESGWSLGHVFDVRVQLGNTPQVLGLIVAAPGLRHRLYGEARRRDPATLTEGAVPWESVQAIGKKRIRVKEVPNPEERQEG
jgi:sporulation protein YlmC with PRC-barrel domain